MRIFRRKSTWQQLLEQLASEVSKNLDSAPKQPTIKQPTIKQPAIKNPAIKGGAAAAIGAAALTAASAAVSSYRRRTNA
jgi:hypothetical protein